MRLSVLHPRCVLQRHIVSSYCEAIWVFYLGDAEIPLPKLLGHSFLHSRDTLAVRALSLNEAKIKPIVTTVGCLLSEP